eukprot:4132549-Pleurochrysis_carterae.AAC.2
MGKSFLPHLTDRDIVIDVETCGGDRVDPGLGRLLDFAAVEVLGRGAKIGKVYQFYCNPEYEKDDDMRQEAVQPHKLRVEFLKGHPTFKQQHKDLEEFLEGAGTVFCHGTVRGSGDAKIFDQEAVNKECRRLGLEEILAGSRINVFDTMEIARDVMPLVNPMYSRQRGGEPLNNYSLPQFVLAVTGCRMDAAKAHSAKYDAVWLAYSVIEATAILRHSSAEALKEASIARQSNLDLPTAISAMCDSFPTTVVP